MTLFKVYAARCDTCGDVRYTEETTAYDARRSLGRADWTFAQGGANKSITYTCGECNGLAAAEVEP